MSIAASAPARAAAWLAGAVSAKADASGVEAKARLYEPRPGEVWFDIYVEGDEKPLFTWKNIPVAAVTKKYLTKLVDHAWPVVLKEKERRNGKQSR